MILLPPAKIGVIGGGQLGMLITQAAKRLGYNVAILDPDSSCPARVFADDFIHATFSDPDAFDCIAGMSDVLTYEFEHIDTDILAVLEERGYRVFPSIQCLSSINDKYRQKHILEKAGIPVPAVLPVCEMNSFSHLDRLGLPVVFKSRCGGYDGKGTIVVRTKEEARETWNDLCNKNAMVEAFVDYEREVSIIAAKDLNGNVCYYPLAENYHENGILRTSKVPAPVDAAVEKQAIDIAAEVLSVFDSPGIFCIEMFLDKEHRLSVNEIAPRPHNSGHYTLDACQTSQYEQLVRIVTGNSLGCIDQISPAVMVNLLGSDGVYGEYLMKGAACVKQTRNAHMYWYGKKTTKPLRKLGHITVLAASLDEAKVQAKNLEAKIRLTAINAQA